MNHARTCKAVGHPAIGPEASGRQNVGPPEPEAR